MVSGSVSVSLVFEDTPPVFGGVVHRGKTKDTHTFVVSVVVVFFLGGGAGGGGGGLGWVWGVLVS